MCVPGIELSSPGSATITVTHSHLAENLPLEEFGVLAQIALLVVCKPAFSGAVSSADSGATCGSVAL